jgi:DeoR/GlpR family transcriptional regulator of sugar metabolism
MNVNERQARILDRLETKGSLSVEDAVKILKVSSATVRRDFAGLVLDRKAERFHGGLRRLRGYWEEISLASREALHSREKSEIARHAAGLLRPGDVLMVDGGTSTLYLARHLPVVPLRVITNSLQLAVELAEKRAHDARLEVFLTGGFLQPLSSMLGGAQTKASLAQYHANWAFLSAGGVTTEGVFNTSELVVESEQAMIANADRVVLLADHSKLGQQAMCRVCGLDGIDLLVTDRWEEHQSLYESLRQAGLEVALVS